MGLIITKIKKLLKGYPTVSDKYNVAGGTSESDGIEFGDVVSYGSTPGYYVAYDASKGIAGINMAKNVKLINQYPANGAIVTVNKGEAIDLFVDGYIAVELAVEAAGETPTQEEIDAALAAVTEGATAYVTADGKFSTTGSVEYGKFTGITEYNYGKALAEIVVK